MEIESPKHPADNDQVVYRVFESFGILETMLSYAGVEELLQATLVNSRWKSAGRTDSLWEPHTTQLWEGKFGVKAEPNPIYWRTLYTNECVQRMSASQIISVFHQPLLAGKKPILEKITDGEELERFYRVHMLDIMSGASQNNVFYADIQFGSYASSLIDSKRDSITQWELCTNFGFDMYFKIAREDVDETDQFEFTAYEESEDILLYHYGTGIFDESYEFHMMLRQEVHSHHPTGTLIVSNGFNGCSSIVWIFL